MEIDPQDVIETAHGAVRAPESRVSRLNTVVAITVAILATFMGMAGLAGWQIHPEMLVKLLT